MNTGFARIYQKTLLDRLVVKMQQKQHLFEANRRDYPSPEKMRNFWEFDDHFTAPIHGFDSAEHYYSSSSSRQFLSGIDKPTLVLHSRDDPFMSADVLPGEHELSDSITLELSDHGGHVGFVTSNGLLKPDSWLQQRVHRFLIEQQFI